MIDHLRRLATSDEAAYVRLSSLSYNVVLTDTYIHVVPRAAECWETPDGEKVSINSLAFAGMVLVKSEKALEAVKSIGVLEVLRLVGYTPVAPGETEEEVKEAEE
jgi:ATP adenylyltransferase